MITEQRKQRLTEALSKKQPDLTVVCENIHDPHNVSAIVRTADAVGIDTLHLVYYKEVFPNIAKKTSAGLKKWLQFKRHTSVDDCVTTLKQADFFIYATSLDPCAVSMFEIDWTKPSAIVMGNEHRGVSSSWFAAADKMIYIPMMGLAQSLNVSVATAIILYEALRQRQREGMYLSNRWNPEIFQEKLALWMTK